MFHILIIQTNLASIVFQKFWPGFCVKPCTGPLDAALLAEESYAL